MSKKTKTKALSAPAAQSREEAQEMVARIGEISRELVRQEADLGDRLAAIKAEAETKAQPLKAELTRLHDAIQTWAEANREELTRQGRTKTVELTTGKVSWRNRPPKVSLRNVEGLIAYGGEVPPRRLVVINPAAIGHSADIHATTPADWGKVQVMLEQGEVWGDGSGERLVFLQFPDAAGQPRWWVLILKPVDGTWRVKTLFPTSPRRREAMAKAFTLVDGRPD